MGRPTLNYARPGAEREVGPVRFRLGRTLVVSAVICVVVLAFYCAMMPWEMGPAAGAPRMAAPPMEYRPPVWKIGPVLGDE